MLSWSHSSEDTVETPQSLSWSKFDNGTTYLGHIVLHRYMETKIPELRKQKVKWKNMGGF